MKKRQQIKTTIQQAADYWSQYVDECGLSVDWSEATTHCWRCGCEKNLQRCHIVPDSLGGKDEPSNIVLLCRRCHADGPNVMDPVIMWDWIRAYSVPWYNTFWTFQALNEYQFIYHCTIVQSIKEICVAAGLDFDSDAVSKTFIEMMKAVYDKASTHFGQMYYNTATMAGMFRIAVKGFAEKYHVQFGAKTENSEEKREEPWWCAGMVCEQKITSDEKVQETELGKQKAPYM